VIFTKFPGSINGPTGNIMIRGETVDYEAELVVVIGKTTKDVPQADAWDHVAGLTVGQDTSDRKV
jgi:2,4-diketo-3-deoxy-L-fuconate hydrolase